MRLRTKLGRHNLRPIEGSLDARPAGGTRIPEARPTPFITRRDDFPRAKLAARSQVGQVVNLRRIGNPPTGSTHNSGDTPSLFAARSQVGQPILAAAGFQPARSDRGRIRPPL